MSKSLFMKKRATGAVFLVVAAGGLLAGCAQDIKELRAQAVEEFRGQQYVQSMATLREVLEMDRADAQANYYMGLNYRTIAARKFRQGDVTAACRELDIAGLYFTEALKSWPNYMAAAEARNEAFEARGKYDEALAVSQRVARNNKGVSEHFVVLGNEYRERGDYDNALRSYKLALSTSPDSAKAYEEMASLYQRIGNRKLAMDAYQKAYELDPSRAGVSDQLNRLQGSSDARIASDEGMAEP